MPWAARGVLGLLPKHAFRFSFPWQPSHPPAPAVGQSKSTWGASSCAKTPRLAPVGLFCGSRDEGQGMVRGGRLSPAPGAGAGVRAVAAGRVGERGREAVGGTAEA